MAVTVIAALAVAGASYWVGTKFNLSSDVATMRYLGTEDPGPDPFTESAVAPGVEDAVRTVPEHAPTDTAALRGAVEGSSDDLYGGTGELSACDAAALVENLNKDEKLKRAFAAGIGIRPEDVDTYVASLDPLVLMRDTWVTNHGYSRGTATPFQSVLVKGTGVLADSFGVPRVRCSCGNPLAEAWDGYTVPSGQDQRDVWQGYDENSVVTVFAGDSNADELSITDLTSGQPQDHPIDPGSTAAQDEVRARVDSDTPRTTLRDMKGSPDTELLESKGLPAAGPADGSRPSGGDRFVSFNTSLKAGGDAAFPDWQSQTTPVDPATFRTFTNGTGENAQSIFYLPIAEHGEWCLVKDDNPAFSVECSVGVMSEHVFGPGYEGAPEGPVSTVQGSTGTITFTPYSSFDTAPGGSMVTPPPLKVGESFSYKMAECFNLADEFGCVVGEFSSFTRKSDGRVFINESALPVGATCGRWTDPESGLSGQILVKGASLDCAEMEQIAGAFLRGDALDNGMSCTQATPPVRTKQGKLATCEAQEGTRPKFGLLIGA